MQTRKFDELISYFNRKVSSMDIDQKCKMELLGMITAIGVVHEKEMPHWVLCSERLPEDVEEGQEYPTVIYSTNSGEVAAGWYELLTQTWWRESASDDVIKSEVIAWMPLPEPYRGGDEG